MPLVGKSKVNTYIQLDEDKGSSLAMVTARQEERAFPHTDLGSCTAQATHNLLEET